MVLRKGGPFLAGNILIKGKDQNEIIDDFVRANEAAGVTMEDKKVLLRGLEEGGVSTLLHNYSKYFSLSLTVVGFKTLHDWGLPMRVVATRWPDTKGYIYVVRHDDIFFGTGLINDGKGTIAYSESLDEVAHQLKVLGVFQFEVVNTYFVRTA